MTNLIFFDFLTKLVLNYNIGAFFKLKFVDNKFVN